MVLALDMPTQPNGGTAYQKFVLGEAFSEPFSFLNLGVME